jgi:hypothetical protein
MGARPAMQQQSASGIRDDVRDNTRDGARDFDFLHGNWAMHNLRLVKRLADSREWVEFASTNECQPLPGGLGNQDIYRTDYWPDFVGMTFRFYNPVSKQWSIYWADNRGEPGVLQRPVVGAFDNGVGIFEGDDSFNGAVIRVRFTWTVIGETKARWEQAFSPDEGKTWETNWYMDFTRLPA